ncbi:MAG: hypothetical protein JSS67_06005 [Bacteroidetes bacterium]|nr:hypothetical protein [Bacteroidota bacterium]
MQFKDIPGQNQIAGYLKEMANHNRLGHTLLFLSNEGSGALSLALAFAQYLVCEKRNFHQTPVSSSLFGEDILPAINPGELPADSCGECPSCIRAQQFIHPDIHFSYPVITKKSATKTISALYAKEWREFLNTTPYGNVFDWLQKIEVENQQGKITADECMDIIRKFSLKSFENGLKILILWMPEYLSKEGNILLKLIEEPPPDTLFILVSESVDLILPTIVSRCQLIKIPAIENEALIDTIVEKQEVSREMASQAVAISAGNYREAIQILRDTEEDWQTVLSNWLNFAIKARLSDQVKWIEEMNKLGREKQKQFLRYFLHLAEISMRIHIVGPQNITATQKEIDFSKRLIKVASMEQMEAIASELNNAIYFIERNANAKLLFHALTIKLYHIIHQKTLILTS